MSARTWDKGLVLTALAVAVISSVSVWLAWRASPDLPQRITLAALAPIFTAATVSYSLRIVRFHYFLIQSGVKIPLRGTLVVQVVGFALSVTPGHIGEVFKLHLIRERAGTSVVRTAPLLLLDRFTEGGGFLILAVLSTLALPQLRAQIPTPALTLVGLLAIAGFALVQYVLPRRALAEKIRWEKIPGVRRFLPHLQNLWHGLESSFTLPQILGGLALSTVARFADGLVVLFAARMLGLELSLPAAVLVLAVSGLAGGFSLLPAGTGAVETTMVGLLVLLGATLPNALSITLVARLSTLWMWVALGLCVAFVLRTRSGQTSEVMLDTDA